MLSRLLLLKNNKCCGEGCLMCPYEPKHMVNSKLIRKDVLDICSEEEITIIKNLYK
jgi:hypothetical protein